MAQTIEFWKEKNTKIYATFNNKKYLLEEFLHLEEGAKVINLIYHKILAEYFHKIEKEVGDKTNLPLVVGTFIKKYFLDKDKYIDVVILGDGSIVNFNLENDFERI